MERDRPESRASALRRHLLTLRRFWGTALAGQLEYQAKVWIELLAMAANLAPACSRSRRQARTRGGLRACWPGPG